MIPSSDSASKLNSLWGGRSQDSDRSYIFSESTCCLFTFDVATMKILCR